MEAAGKQYKRYDIGRLTSLGTVGTGPMIFLEHQKNIFSIYLTSDEEMSVKMKGK